MNSAFSNIISENYNEALNRVGQIKKMIDSYTKTSTTPFSSYLSVHAKANEKKYEPSINEAAFENNVDPTLVKAIIKTESGFNPGAISGAGAMGLMQLMPGTARDMGAQNPLATTAPKKAGKTTAA